jgi:hypothetical protein
MRKISLVAASVLALGWATAKAETATSASAGVDVDTPSSSDTANTPAPAASPTTVTTPNATVTAPPGSTTTIKAPAAGAGSTATTAPSPTDPNAAVPGDLPTAPTTNVEVTTPSTDTSANTAQQSDTDNAVVMPAPVQPAPVQPMPATQNDNRYVERQYGPGMAAPRIGAAFLVGGGFQDFSRSNARNVTGQGGYWNARLIFGTRQFVGFEAAYVGSARDINALGLASNAMLVSNGAEGVLRINVPIQMRGDALIEPFAFGGAGWSRYHVTRSATNTSDIAPNDDVLEVPYGAGLGFSAAHFMADARFTYRSSFYNDLLRTTGGRLDNWSAGGQIGFEF